ncbi:MAG TPA: polysaccharide biosynthesis protein [Epsilonproteobacteria bacterium]|nr:polysaccharide biosynthesis protein [Campylobacterota bacterium]
MVVKRLLRPTAFKRMFFFIIIDILLSLATFYLAYTLRFNFHIPGEFFHIFWKAFTLLVLLKVFFLYLFKNYFIVWRFFGFMDAKNIIKAHIFTYVVFAIMYLLFREYFMPFPRSVIAIDFFLSLIFIGALRISRRMARESTTIRREKPTLIIGANSKTGTIIQSALNGEIDYYPTAIIAYRNNDEITDAYMHNIKIYDNRLLEEIITEKGIVAAIVTEKIPASDLKIIADRLSLCGINEIKKVRILGDKDEKLEDLSIEDLLARHPKDLDLETIASFIKGKSVLITGAGGSIGSEISKQCQQFGASTLTLVDHSEYNLYQIGELLPQANLKLLNITNKHLLEEIFEEVHPDIVIHAAAYKHVPVCENNQETAVYNNVYGSKNVIDTSIKYAVEKVVLISTDKAVRPTNVMGATKRVTELYAQNIISTSNTQNKKTEIVAVRFGNVLGSSGSVIPKFKAQIEAGEAVTVTHPEITRYFMLIPEACQLVLQTAAIAKGGELFILDMGEPIKIVDLAKQMIRLYGKEDEIEIIFTGLRPGEKLYEELLLDESEQKTKYSSIFIAKPTPYDITQLTHDIEVLLESEDKVAALQKIVPEFTRKGSL